ncbi:MAG: bifunctional phosphopantothenoylcysteine decarboxylase/phosphopantothenate--cysteine ligase CoaBC [Chitinophaga sp.]|nr:bifunctional phosphopantothenoylcysteine decarboxylase/phosphopantothenate--cysteine ligase CoaBC [Chitinophaga sp.]
MFLDKKILVGITGSISAYKMYHFIRLLKQQGASIKVIITPTAKTFVSSTILSTFSEHKVYCEFVEDDLWQNHVHLGRWADLFVIAPSSCATIAKLTNGLADNFLVATYLSCPAPVVIFPAMDEDMWMHPSTQHNIATLRQRGNTVVEPSTGSLASGINGKGRLPEIEEMITYIESKFFRQSTLSGKTVLVTAGPTEEPIDPVRVITNRSSGKMGYAIAESLYMLGADVYLVSGPVAIKTKYDGIHLIQVKTANEMYAACLEFQSRYDYAVFTAAVADYTIPKISNQKIKKSGDTLQINLVKTKDILGSFGLNKLPHQKIIGFALETDHEVDNAIEKLNKKNADLIVLNQLNDSNICFNQNDMKVSLISKDQIEAFDTLSKSEIASRLTSFIIKNWL